MCLRPPRARSSLAAVAALLLIVPATALAQATPTPLDPDAPMAELPGLGIDWPAVDGPEPTPIAGVPQTADVPRSDNLRYRVDVAGIDTLDSVVADRFDALSVLKEGQGKPANAAQINRRITDDSKTLNEILRIEGYYDARIDYAIAATDSEYRVTLTVEPGARYTFTDIAVNGLGTADVKGLALAPGDPADTDRIVAEQEALALRLGNQGYPFAKVGEPQLVVNHENRNTTLALDVQPGGKRNFGAITLRNANAPFDARHVQTIARFRPGETFDRSLVDDLRRALVATGLVSGAVLEPVEGTAPGTVDIATTIEPAPPRTIAGEIGYGTGEGFRVEASWQHRNLIRPEGAVTFRGVLGTKEQSASAILRVNNFRRRDQVLNGSLIAQHERRTAYDATSFGIAGSLERQTNIIWQKLWTYSYGAELIATDERDFVPTSGIAQRRTYYIGALPLRLAYDGTDDLLDPKRGFRLSGRLSPEVSLAGSVYTYVRTQIDASGYVPVSDRVVIAGRTRIGSTTGAAREAIAPSRRFYAGGGGSVRGFGYQDIGARNVLGDPIGGRSLAEFSLEARVRLPIFGGNFGVVPFVDAGNVYTGSLPDFSGLRIGVGAGLRYYSGFGPIRIDVGTPLARRPGESLIAVQVSLGQAF